MFTVNIKFKQGSTHYRHGRREDTLTDIVEIHFNYDNHGRIAFEREHSGETIDISDIYEFEAKD